MCTCVCMQQVCVCVYVCVRAAGVCVRAQYILYSIIILYIMCSAVTDPTDYQSV